MSITTCSLVADTWHITFALRWHVGIMQCRFHVRRQALHDGWAAACSLTCSIQCRGMGNLARFTMRGIGERRVVSDVCWNELAGGLEGVQKIGMIIC